ncbi:MAG: DUF1501 domain-containing protein [Flavobacteriales bacterium]|nr:DUF1501 domain-containing protein [Flavobacteriales bacterium]
MKRRDFLRSGALSAAFGYLTTILPQKSLATTLMRGAVNCNDVEDRILVFIYLGGGNDLWNTLVPLSQYSTYASYRPKIKVPDLTSSAGACIELDSALSQQKAVGLHPNLGAIKNLYDQNKLTVLNNIGYPNMNKSHFTGTDIWNTGGDGNVGFFDSGWTARAMDYIYGNPSNRQHPVAIELGHKKNTLLFKSNGSAPISVNLYGQDPAGYYSLIQTIGGIPPTNLSSSDCKAQIDYMWEMAKSTEQYSQYIDAAFNAGSNSSNVTYPTPNNNDLANQLKTVARLISGGLKTKIYRVFINGFDNHGGMVTGDTGINPADIYNGAHAEKLQLLNEAIELFQQDITDAGNSGKVLTVTYTEFGRKLEENSNYGTDHGTVGSMFVIGDKVNPGVIGNNVDFNTINGNGHFDNFETDYRQVYTTLLQDWFGIPDSGLTATNFQSFINQKLNIINPSEIAPTNCYLSTNVPVVSEVKPSIIVYPNPVVEDAEIRTIQLLQDKYQVTVFDAHGKLVHNESIKISSDLSSFKLRLRNIKSGNYTVRMIGEQGGMILTSALVKI